MRKNEVKALSEIEHVLQRPGMYLGDVTLGSHKKWCVTEDGKISKEDVEFVPALLKMFDEVISNSIDEGLRTGFKFANEISVEVKDGYITVEDNGRGIPTKKAEGSDKTMAEMAFTNLRAGSNFGDDSFVSIGTHGLGSTLVNIMSSIFQATTDDGSKKMVLQCTDNMSSSKVKYVKSTKKVGTRVMFLPDYERFNLRILTDEHIRLIHKRVLDLSVCYPDVKFRWNGKIVRSTNFRAYLKQISESFECLETDDYKIAVIPSEEPDQISFVNGIDTYEGGTHVDLVRNKIVYQLQQLINKKYKKLNIKPQDIRNHLTFVVITNKINNPKFRSQTKEYITNNASEFDGLFNGSDDKAFIGRIMRNDDIILPIIETQKLKAEAAERVALKKAKKNAKKIKVASHIPASSKNYAEKILFITEGASAIGQLCKVRDPARHGGFPLRGKPMNVRGKRPTEIIKNEELKNLMSILGIALGEKATHLEYGTIAILADADYDGLSICGLLMNFFSHWPELFEEERIHIIKSPILTAQKGKQIKRFYSVEDFNEAKIDKSWNLTYLKGLGSLNENEYERMIQDPVVEVVKLDEKGHASLEKVFGSDANLRKEWLME